MDPTALLEIGIAKETCGTYRCFVQVLSSFDRVSYIAIGVCGGMINKMPLDFCTGCSLLKKGHSLHASFSEYSFIVSSDRLDAGSLRKMCFSLPRMTDVLII